VPPVANARAALLLGTHAPAFPAHDQVAAINTAMSALVKTLNVFPTERSIVARERGRHAYGVLPYLSGAHTLRQWGGGEKAVPVSAHLFECV
jgi:hypothetical protein